MGKDQSLICRKSIDFPPNENQSFTNKVTDLCPPINIRLPDRQIFVLNFKGRHLGTSLKLFSATHRESDTRFSTSSFFHTSVFPGPLSTSFQIFFKNLRRYSRMNVYQRYLDVGGKCLITTEFELECARTITKLRQFDCIKSGCNSL